MIFHKKIEDIYKNQMFVRCDDKGVVSYFSHKDFKGLMAEEYTIRSSKGNILKGYFYSYENEAKAPLAVFEHGFGGGHRSYMKEIEMLCKKGYYVFAYDHTGCMESEGENAGGILQSLADLNDVLKALKSDNNVNTSEIYVIGHSWGGFSTMNIPKFHPDIKKIVCFSGVTSLEQFLKQNFPGILRGYRKYIVEIEKSSNPELVSINAVDSLKNSKTKALLIYSSNDTLVKKEYHYDYLKSGLEDLENIEFMLENNKGHNPNYTEDAVKYLAEMTKSIKSAKLDTPEQRKAFRDSFDWHKMTEQDLWVWNKIFEFLAE